MVSINYLRDKYATIVLYGAVENTIKKYIPFMNDTDHIIDSNRNKKGNIICNYSIESPDILLNCELNNSNTAIVIIPLAFESEIYNTIRKNGFIGDVYSEDMISFSDNENSVVTDGGVYTIEKHTQILIALLKVYGIKNIVVSPGYCNMNFVQSVLSDGFFKLWSCIDERSAAYMACGMAQTTGEPVVISCTGATASRNYMSALTEAYYSHLPIIAITSSRESYMIGNGIDQITDRLHLPTDIVKDSVEISFIHTLQEKKYCELKINRVLTAMRMHEGGPVHINLITHFQKDFSVKTLPRCKKIETYQTSEKASFPNISGKVAIYIRPSVYLSEEVSRMMETFCRKYNAVVIGDCLSNYKGEYFINIYSLCNCSNIQFDLLIYTGAMNSNINIRSKKSWRISQDGRIEDSFLNQECMFDMSLEEFMTAYITDSEWLSNDNVDISLYNELKKKYDTIINSLDKLPFSNVWAAKRLVSRIPENSNCYLGIFSTLSNWRIFDWGRRVNCYSTVGGYGIDGTLSAMLGASFINTQKLHFCFLGDLSFFYDLNSIGNCHVGNNVRIMVFNNNGGNSLLYKNGMPKELQLERYISAKNHYNNLANKPNVIKSYAESLGFQYLLAIDKEEFNENCEIFLDEADMPIIFELRYAEQNDFDARDIVNSIKDASITGSV